MSIDTLRYPTFTIPTLRCCSLILTFDDIAAILSNAPHIVQVGLGELERNQHLIDLGVEWLFAPKNWSVLVSGFNPAIADPKQIFQYDAHAKTMTISNGVARISMSYPSMMELVSRVQSPAINLVSLPCEEEDELDHDTTVEDELRRQGKTKVKRKVARRNQSFTDSLETINQSTEGSFKFVVPVIGSQQPVELASGIPNVIGSTRAYARVAPGCGELNFVQIRNASDLNTTLAEIRNAIDSKADVIETDFPFHIAKLGLLLNEQFELVDLKDPIMFSENTPLLTVDQGVPMLVANAASHMKSYIHHLFRCEELSGPILLATVNLFQFEKLFKKYS